MPRQPRASSWPAAPAHTTPTAAAHHTTLRQRSSSLGVSFWLFFLLCRLYLLAYRHGFHNTFFFSSAASYLTILFFFLRFSSAGTLARPWGRCVQDSLNTFSPPDPSLLVFLTSQKKNMGGLAFFFYERRIFFFFFFAPYRRPATLLSGYIAPFGFDKSQSCVRESTDNEKKGSRVGCAWTKSGR